jgi:hypothetical protein
MPMAGATCCANGYTACPANTRCVDSGADWRVVSACVPTTAEHDGANTTGWAVCKQGPPLPMSTTLKNVLVLGDSVSIGYTPFVNKALSDIALVQHSPWGGDGGAEETQYGWRCLDYLLRQPDGTPAQVDALYWNFGLHNTGSGTLPGQAGPVAEYAPYLRKIAAELSGWAARTGTKLMFGVTTPMLNNAATDAVVMSNNRDAASIAAEAGIPTLDMHAAVVGKCGAVPQDGCFGQKGCFSPHCVPAGYEWLANSTIAPAIRKLLE